ncbi:MAG TPA: LamG-like jellyroll fold domain-containing protein, partial [Candidatus Acidoferrum sp.]|nr:LamG-like jellyroll fold domain-containing protein [Candidatus Acidoferrum sp.]
MTTQARFIGFTLFMAASLLFQARADITTGLVGYWKFTDGPGSATAADATANANNGTLTGFSDATHNSMWTTSSDPNNTWPYALIFNQGSDTADYVSVPDSASLDTIPSVKKFTLAAWVNLSASPGSAGAAILCRGTGGGGEVWCMDVYQSHFRLFIRNSTGGNVSTAISTNVSPSVGTWYHVVGTYDAGATLKLLLYVNGVKQGDSGSGSTTTLTSTNRVVSIGNRQSGTGPFNLPFPGTIDEVRIYNTTLAATDVAQLYAYKAFPVVNKGIGSWNGLAGGGGNATLDTTSLNFCTNLYTAPVGTADSLADLLNVQSAGALPLACSLADFYYSGGNQVAVQSTNLTLASGGVAIGTANGPGTLTCLNVSSTYTLTSPDTIGLTDGPNPTALAQSGHGTVILIGTNTFSGSVNINSGTVQLGNGNISVGQELGSTTSITDNGALVFNGTNALDFTKTLSGMGSLTVRNCPSLTLNTGNNYSGGTTLVNTTLTLNSLADGGCPLGTGPVTLNGATLLYTGAGDSTVRQFIGTTGTTNAIDVPASVNLELANRLNAAGAWIVNKTGGGTLTLSGTADNSWLGMNITTGTVVLNKSAGATGAGLGGPTTVASGALLQLGNTGYGKQIYSGSTTPITISSGGVLDMDGQANAIYSLSLAGVGSGSGALINSLGSTTAYITNSGTGVVLADNTLIGGVGNLTFLGPISGGYTLTYGGSATLTLAGSGSSYSGGTAVTNGTLDVATALAIPGNVTLSGPATLELDDPNALPVLATLTLPSSPADNTVYLNFSGSDSIAVLVIGGVSQAPGTYGAPGSGATYTSTVFNSAGAGVLNVTGQGNWDPSRSGIAPGSGGTGAWDTTTANWL